MLNTALHGGRQNSVQGRSDPLLPSLPMEPATMSRTSTDETLSVQCGGKLCTAQLMQNGDFVCRPAVDFNTSEGSCCCNCRKSSSTLTEQLVPAKQLVGAETDGAALRVVYCVPSSSRKNVVPARITHKSRKGPWLQCDSVSAASNFAMVLRRSASWWERPAAPRISIIVNPASGRGGGLEVVSSVLLPLLRDAAGLSVTVLQTLSRGHATMLVREMDPASFDLLVLVGGDGTIYEALQGLLGRSDWEQGAKLPFAAVPAGSGNGLAASTGMWDAVTAAFSITRGRTHPLDIASVLQPPSTRVFAFLSLVFGTMSNLDIGTEHLRWLGELRFTLGGLSEILKGKTYNAHVAYLPPSSQTATNDSSQQRQKGGSAAADSTTAGLSTSTVDVAATHPTANPTTSMSDRLLQERPPVISSRHTSSCSVSSFPRGPPLPLLSALGPFPSALGPPPSSPSYPSVLPPEWRYLGRPDLQLFGLYNTQYVALNVRLNPTASLACGSWELQYTYGQQGLSGRLAGLDLLTKSEDGSHTTLPFVCMDRARAVIFTPISKDTWTVLDGEAAPFSTLFLEVHPALCKVLVAPDWSE